MTNDQLATPATYPTALAWAQARTKNERPRLGALEAHALQNHLDIVAGLSSDGVLLARRRRPLGRVRGTLSCLGAIVALAFVASPVAGMAVNAAVDVVRYPTVGPTDPVVGIPIAAALFAAAVVTGLVLLITWLVQGARWEPMRCTWGFVAAAMGGFALSNMSIGAAREGYVIDQWQRAPVIATVVIGTILFVGTLVRIKAKRPAELERLEPTVEARDGALRALAALPAAERAVMTDDRNAALAALHEAGFIDEPTYHGARSAPLGTLGRYDTHDA